MMFQQLVLGEKKLGPIFPKVECVQEFARQDEFHFAPIRLDLLSSVEIDFSL
jgi:hypothetical protein